MNTKADSSVHTTRLQDGKRELRRERISMTLPEKVRQVVQLQKIHVTAASRRRKLGALERVWTL